MKNDIALLDGIVIPEHELEITTSRAGGPGGQHVNKTNSKVTLRWNVKTSAALTEEQKARVLEKLQAQLTTEGDLIVHSSESRSQLQNNQIALIRLAAVVNSALAVPKKRRPTRMSKNVKETRLDRKKHHGMLKAMRSKKFQDD